MIVSTIPLETIVCFRLIYLGLIDKALDSLQEVMLKDVIS
jgi:hypothetical protein